MHDNFERYNRNDTSIDLDYSCITMIYVRKGLFWKITLNAYYNMNLIFKFLSKKHLVFIRCVDI